MKARRNKRNGKKAKASYEANFWVNQRMSFNIVEHSLQPVK